MKEFLELLLNYPMWVKITVFLLGAIIVFLLITFRPPSTSQPLPPAASQEKTSLNAGRDIVAGRDIIINKQNYLYLKDKYLMEGILRDGWYGFGPPKEILDNPTDNLNIFPIGLANHRLGFVVASGPGAHYKVDLLYLKLRAYSPCSLRNEYVTVQAFMGLTTAALHISEDYDIYPIYPLNDSLTQTVWTYQGRDVDEFTVYLSFKDYVLYLITINIDYIDLHTNKRQHIETDEFTLIDAARGNTGGCFDVRSWFSNDMRLQPKRRNYDDGVPFDIYQLLSADLSRNPGLMNTFINNRNLVNRKKEVERIVNSRPENSVFVNNYKRWIDALNPK
jgi:hypothetical protein